MYTIRTDERPIKMIAFDDTNFFDIDVNCVRIVPYEENGEMAAVTWFEVYYNAGDKKPRYRINGKFVREVVYDTDPPGGEK